MTEQDDDLVPAVPLKSEPSHSWLARERRTQAEREQRDADERAENERRTVAAIARVKALATDNGSGFCRSCGVKFTQDEQGRNMHPENDCAGIKPANCPECGREPVIVKRGNARIWELPCGPADHARARGATNPASDITITPPQRVGSDDED